MFSVFQHYTLLEKHPLSSSSLCHSICITSTPLVLFWLLHISLLKRGMIYCLELCGTKPFCSDRLLNQVSTSKTLLDEVCVRKGKINKGITTRTWRRTWSYIRVQNVRMSKLKLPHKPTLMRTVGSNTWFIQNVYWNKLCNLVPIIGKIETMICLQCTNSN